MSLIELTSTMTENESRAVQNSNNGFLSGTVPSFATQAEAEAGTDNTKIMSPLGVKQQILSLVYPVGSVYISVNNVNPSTYLGGTWAAFAQGRALFGVDTTQTEFNTVLKTGGAKTHNLQTSELPAHTHTIPDHQHNLRYLNAGGSGGVIWSLPTSEGPTAYSGANIQNGGGGGATSSVGSGSAHNNLPPYITVYMWRRTA